MLRALWTERSVTFEGRFHRIEAAGIAPLPVQRPIPIWIGAFEPAALRRVGRLADGWFPMARPRGGLEEALEQIREGAAEVGRDLSNFQFEGRLEYADPRRRQDGRARPALGRGGGHPPVGEHDALGLTDADAHIAALSEVAPVLL